MDRHARPSASAAAHRVGASGPARPAGWARTLALVALVLLLTACSVRIPADPDGTLERVTGGQLRVGVSHNPPWTDISGDAPTGTETKLIAGFAVARDAGVVWEAGGEEQLMTQLRDGRLDVVIGGLTDESPWTSHAALTTPYTQAARADGSTEQHVLAVPLGENAFMVALEQHALAWDDPGLER